MRVTDNYITVLKANEIFVFGSNLAGIHGAGAAKMAHELFGAKWGIGYGLEGQSFALPTKDRQIETLTLTQIKHFVDQFIKFAKRKPQLTFLVTEVGCKLAGYEPHQIAPLFKDAVEVENIHLPERFWNVLNLE